MFLAKVKQSYKDKVAFLKQKHRFDELMSKTKSAEPKGDIHSTRSLEPNDQNQAKPTSRMILVAEAQNQANQNSENVESTGLNNIDSQPKTEETPPPKKIQINNQAANPEVYGFKVVFFSFIAMWLMNVPIWIYVLSFLF